MKSVLFFVITMLNVLSTNTLYAQNQPDNTNSPEVEQALHKAVAAKSYRQLKEWKEKGAGFNDYFPTWFYPTLLDQAVSLQDTTMINTLLEYGADINREPKRSGVLIVTLLQQEDDMVRFLLRKGAMVSGIEITYAYSLKILKELLKANPKVKLTEEERTEALIHAVRNDDLPLVEYYLSHGAEINGALSGGARPISVVQSQKMLDYLLKKGADEFFLNPKFMSLSTAVERGEVGQVENLIKQGADVNSHEEGEEQPICIWGDVDGETQIEIYKLLLDAGADINTGNYYNGDTPLMRAMPSNYQVEVTRFLLERGAWTNHKDHQGSRAIHKAVYLHYNAEVMEMLLAAGAQINVKDNNGKTPLMIAALEGNAASVEHLLKRGARADIEDFNGYKAENYAMQSGSATLYERLKKASQRTDVDYLFTLLNARKGQPGISTISSLIQNSLDSGLEEEKLLGIGKENRVEAGSTALIIAAQKGYNEIAQALVNLGADIDARDANNNTAMHHCVKNNNLEVAKMLIGSGASFYIENREGATPMNLACRQGNRPMAQLLIQRKCEEYRSSTHPLIDAVENNHLDLVQLLIEQKADLETTDRSGKTPLIIAAQKGFLPLVNYLLEKGADNTNTDDLDKSALDYATDEAVIRTLKQPVKKTIQ